MTKPIGPVARPKRDLGGQSVHDVRTYYREWRAAHRGHVKAEHRLDYEKNREKYGRRAAEQRARDPQGYKDYLTAHSYGITVAQLHQLRAAHNGHCAICEREAVLEVDHDHKTGKVRALLCSKCNKSLGFVEDQEFLRKALAYLEKHR